MNHKNGSPFRAEWVFIAGLLCVVGAGAAMRLAALGEHPYGLYQDEAYNGLDALRVLDGARPLYFPANNGREPFFIYLVAATVGMFGRTALGVRAAAAILGLLTLPAATLLGTAWGNRRTGLLSASILAVMLWHVHLSRVGFRAVALPLFSALALGLGALGLKTRSRWALIGAGVAYGLGFYTYLPALFTPLALALMLAYGLIWHRDWLLERRRPLLWAGGAALIVVLPLIGLAAARPELIFERSGQVAIWSKSVSQGDLPGAVLGSTLRTLGMFTWRGDPIWRHNVPGRPVFDPLLATAFAVGIVLGLAHWRRRPALALSLIWVAVMALPTLLAADAPHFLRAVGVLPVAVLIPALALDAGIRRAGDRPAALIGLIALLGVSAGLTARDYFGCRTATPRLSGFDYAGCYHSDPVRGYFFQAEATDLAREANAAQGMLYLDRRFWDGFASVRFLVGEDEHLILFDEGEPLERGKPPLTLITWPHTDLAPALAVLPPRAQIGVWPGPETRGDLDPEVYRLYVRWTAGPLPELSEPLARFENGMVLLDVETAQEGDKLWVTLRWMAPQTQTAPVQAFVHVMAGDGTTILAQADEPPGSVYYPSLSWEPGSVIIHTLRLAVIRPEQAGDHLRVGLYDPATGDRVPILETGAAQVDGALRLPLDAG